MGDIIIKVDGQAVKEMVNLQEILEYHKAGDKVTLTVLRLGANGYEQITIDVILSAKES